VQTCQSLCLQQIPQRPRQDLSPGFRGKEMGNYPREPWQDSSVLKICIKFRENYCLHPPNHISHHSRPDLRVKDFLFWTNWIQIMILRISSKNHVFLQKMEVNSLRLPNKFVESEILREEKYTKSSVGGWWIARCLITCWCAEFYISFYRLTGKKKSMYSSYSDYHDIIIWDVITCSLVEKHEPFRGTYFLHIWGHLKT
jgi:hypothetical protein